MDNAFRHIHVNYQLVCNFMAVFSRMEYALKVTRFAVGNEGYISASWDKFANEANNDFDVNLSEELAASVEYLWDFPPRRQTLNCERQITFEDFHIDRNQAKLQQLLLMVRTVRNNLFHGGKYSPEGEVEPGRNEALVNASLIILNECASLVPDVAEAFDR